VIEDTVLDVRTFSDRQRVNPLMRLQQPQKVERAVEHADIRIGGDDDGAPAVGAHRSNQVSLAANSTEVALQSERRHDRRSARPGNDGAVRLHVRRRCDCGVEKAVETARQFSRCCAGRRGFAAHHETSDRAAVLLEE
jgi:hypothetical protein